MLSLEEQRRNDKIVTHLKQQLEYLKSLPPEEAKIESNRRLVAAGIYVEKDGELVLAPQYGGPGWDDPEHANNYTQLLGINFS